jgi:uncharacterized RDD family membrane protein YckC
MEENKDKLRATNFSSNEGQDSWKSYDRIESQQIIQPAGFWVRLGASILDGLIIGIPLSILAYMITGDMAGDDWFTNLLSLAYGVIVPVVWYGYTVGKRIVGIRIVKLNGEQVGYGTMLMRAVVASLVYVVTVGLGLIVSAIMVGIREDKRSIHDFIAGTYVTYQKPENNV